MFVKTTFCGTPGINAVPYFFSNKTEVFYFKTNPKNLDPSYKMDLDFWECFGREKLMGLFWKGKTHGIVFGREKLRNGIVLTGKTHGIVLEGKNSWDCFWKGKTT